ncbi:MAG: hypothetical protein CK426_01170 [Legionella sp.]|nr:MAG: hypothetical protein CK423_04785 [Legionella sp.]PJD99842.1 MAG: hypothetical protein CK426_01170 [Legionella sp.]
MSASAEIKNCKQQTVATWVLPDLIKKVTLKFVENIQQYQPTLDSLLTNQAMLIERDRHVKAGRYEKTPERVSWFCRKFFPKRKTGLF